MMKDCGLRRRGEQVIDVHIIPPDIYSGVGDDPWKKILRPENGLGRAQSGGGCSQVRNLAA